MQPITFQPGDLVRYTNAKWPRAGMGPRGPKDKSTIRLTAEVVCQAPGYIGSLTRVVHDPANPDAPGVIVTERVASNRNVLLRFRNGAMVVTLWGHCRLVQRASR